MLGLGIQGLGLRVLGFQDIGAQWARLEPVIA